MDIQNHQLVIQWYKYLYQSVVSSLNGFQTSLSYFKPAITSSHPFCSLKLWDSTALPGRMAHVRTLEGVQQRGVSVFLRCFADFWVRQVRACAKAGTLGKPLKINEFKAVGSSCGPSDSMQA
jgi:hypothetical protein